jgi:hypothetical protein
MRVVRAPDGSLGLDPTGRAPGRGAYLCRDASCWDAAGRKHAVEHALKVPAGAVDALLAAGVPDHQATAIAGGGQPPAGEGGAEHRSERAPRPVSEERTRQRPNAAGSPPPHESDSNDPEGGAHGQE